MSDLPGLPEPIYYRLALRENDLDSKSKLVGFVLDTYMGSERRWRVSVETLARGTGYSERSVRDALRLLEKADLVVTERRRGHSSFYVAQLTPERMEPVHAFFERARLRRGQLTLGESRLVEAPTPAAPAAHPGSSCRPPRQLLPPLVEQEVERQLQTPAGAAGVASEIPDSIEPFRRLAEQIADADSGTPYVLAKVASGLPEAALARAAEALRTRRLRPGKALASEARYVYATLAGLRDEAAA